MDNRKYGEVHVLAVGDLHLRKTAPSMRTDDFFATMERKLNEIFDIAKEHLCEIIVFPGDIFDRHDAPHGLVEWAIRQFARRDFTYLFVFGQHDLRYHTSDKQNSPLGVLCAGLGTQAYILSPEHPFKLITISATLKFHGVSWGEPLPSKFDGDMHHIVVMHRPVTAEDLPWDHDDLITDRDLIKKCPADVFITGDNHTRFVTEYMGAMVVNMGSVLRTSTAQVDHTPMVGVLSFTERTCALEQVQLTIRKKVFDMDIVEAKAANEEKLTAFVAGLQDKFDPELRFIDNLRLAAVDAPDGVRRVIEEVMA